MEDVICDVYTCLHGFSLYVSLSSSSPLIIHASSHSSPTPSSPLLLFTGMIQIRAICTSRRSCHIANSEKSLRSRRANSTAFIMKCTWTRLEIHHLLKPSTWQVIINSSSSSICQVQRNALNKAVAKASQACLDFFFLPHFLPSPCCL